MKIILATAYDINPYKGSESGTGWNFICQISRFNRVIAITRKNNRHNIEKYIKENSINTDNISFRYYDLPYVLRFWKRGPRGAFLYYNLWQVGLVFDIIKSGLKFDAVQHINFHADHVPSFLWLLRKPFIWGPINHNEPIPRQFLPTKTSFLKDRVIFLVKYMRWNIDPFLYLCSRRAVAIIGANSSVKSRLRVSDSKFHKISTVGAVTPDYDQILAGTRTISQEDPFTVISVGRHVPIKSFDVALRAFNDFYCSLDSEARLYVQLLLVGDGPLYTTLNTLARQLECFDAVQFIKWIDQKELFVLYKSSSLMLVPSHEGAGAVVAEAQSYGVPVVCFSNHGAGELIDSTSGIVVPAGDYRASYKAMGAGIRSLYMDQERYKELCAGALKNFEANLSWESKGKSLNYIYKTKII